MSQLISYQSNHVKLLEIKVTHEFFENRKCFAFDFLQEKETFFTLKNLDILVKTQKDGKGDKGGKGDKPQDFKSLTEYSRHVMEKKQKEMEQEEKRKIAEDPDYVPKKPLSPTMPKKEDDKTPTMTANLEF